ncbi:hypothetical protein F353_gp38 [Vibrio phage CP-T1]|uniref:hypothetical protein n=1 Tax=Vibrio phage CP-T1 TaxID=10689 RepID=UPI0002536CDF|nr:hypothetical protein F353_gp38 [Vibrio phage CP-T1]AFC22420.1 hypothetical protein CP-T1_0038 [Vibrio phage CP-T1]AIA08726.1 hypothetical protein SBVc24_0037 [Vibrio phage 24]
MMNLEQLVKWYIIGHTDYGYVLDNLRRMNINVRDDNVTVKVIYGDGYPYHEEMVFSHTSMMLTYINTRFEEILPTVR